MLKYWIFMLTFICHPDVPPDNGSERAEPPLSIMVLDNNFKVLSEKRFPAKKYDAMAHFVTPEGLWLSTNNQGAPDFNENELSYGLLTIEKPTRNKH